MGEGTGFEGRWKDLLGDLTSRGLAPAGLLLAHPDVVGAVLRTQRGRERTVVPLPVQEAVAALVADAGRGKIPALGLTATEVLTRAATWGGLDGSLARRLGRTRNRDVAEALSENPAAPARVLQGLLRLEDRTVRNNLFNNPASSRSLRRKVFETTRLDQARTRTRVEELAVDEQDELAALARHDGPGAQNGWALLTATARRGSEEVHLSLLVDHLQGLPTWAGRVRVSEVLGTGNDLALWEALRRGNRTRAEALEAVRAHAAEVAPLGPEGWAERPTLAEHVCGHPAGSALHLSALGSEDALERRAAVERGDVSADLVVGAVALAAERGTVDPERFLAAAKALPPRGRGDLVLELSRRGGPGRRVAEEVLAQHECDLGLEEVREVLTKLDLAELGSWRRHGLWRRVVRAHRTEALELIRPAGDVVDVVAASQLGTYLSERLTGEQVETFLTLGPTWTGTLGELVEAARRV